MPGDRTTASFKTFVLPGLAGVVVHDRYQVYDHPQPGTLTHQLCCAHLLRDLEDAAQTYLGASWPAQITHALQGLIHAASSARQAGLAAVPTHIASPLISAYRDGIHTGLSDLQKRGGTTRQHRQRLLEDLRDREDDVLRFVSDLRIPPTSNQAERDLRPAKTQEKISGRLGQNKPPASATPSAATSPPPANTAPACSPPCATRSPEPMDAPHPGPALTTSQPKDECYARRAHPGT